MIKKYGKRRYKKYKKRRYKNENDNIMK